jgi:dCMP deaminase
VAKPEALDELYMDIAERVALMSHGIRAKVGAVIVQGDRIISYGWNGTPSGDDNSCETIGEDGELVTKPDVLHAESNALMKLVASGGEGSQGGTLYVTLSPCFECAKLIKQSRINRVVFRKQYRDASGIDFLQTRGVIVEKLGDEE